MGKEIFTFYDRTKGFYEDNVEFLADLSEKYVLAKGKYKELLITGKISGEDNLNGFKGYLSTMEYIDEYYPEDTFSEKFYSNSGLLNFALLRMCEFEQDELFKVVDGKVKNNVFPIDLSVDKVNNNAIPDKARNKGMILPNGHYYYINGKSEHYVLSSWLMLNGIDTRSAIRTTRDSFAPTSPFYFSTMDGLCNHNPNMLLTNEQAKGMYNFYIIGHTSGYRFQQIVDRSASDGFRVFKNRENVYTLEDVSKEMSEKNNRLGDDYQFKESRRNPYWF